MFDKWIPITDLGRLSFSSFGKLITKYLSQQILTFTELKKLRENYQNPYETKGYTSVYNIIVADLVAEISGIKFRKFWKANRKETT